MEQLFLIIQQIYELLELLNSYLQDEREELVKGYQRFLFEANDLLRCWIVSCKGKLHGVGRLNGDPNHGN